jgi:hypothetical protein
MNDPILSPRETSWWVRAIVRKAAILLVCLAASVAAFRWIVP